MDPQTVTGLALGGFSLLGVGVGPPPSRLDGMDLTGRFLALAELSATTARAAVLAYADLRGAIAEAWDATGADLSGAELRGALLACANLSFTRCVGASFADASLVGADLTGADLRGADLQGADLTAADLTGANVDGAVASGATRWPARFVIPRSVLIFPQPPAADLVPASDVTVALQAAMLVLQVRARVLAPEPLPLADAVAELLARGSGEARTQSRVGA